MTSRGNATFSLDDLQCWQKASIQRGVGGCVFREQSLSSKADCEADRWNETGDASSSNAFAIDVAL